MGLEGSRGDDTGRPLGRYRCSSWGAPRGPQLSPARGAPCHPPNRLVTFMTSARTGSLAMGGSRSLPWGREPTPTMGSSPSSDTGRADPQYSTPRFLPAEPSRADPSHSTAASEPCPSSLRAQKGQLSAGSPPSSKMAAPSRDMAASRGLGASLALVQHGGARASVAASPSSNMAPLRHLRLDDAIASLDKGAAAAPRSFAPTKDGGCLYKERS